MKHAVMSAAVVLCLGAASLFAAPAALPRGGASTPAGFTDDFDAAKAAAARDFKLMAVVFTGSDWCPWCRKLDGEILSKPEFVKAAKDDFVLVFLDKPSNPGLLSSKAKVQNPTLMSKYDIHGFPTVLLMDAKGTVVGRTGYQQSEPAAYAEMLRGKAAAALKGLEPGRKALALPAGSPERLKAFDAFLAPLSITDRCPYAAWIQELVAADKDGSLGYKARYGSFAALAEQVKKLAAIDAELLKARDEAGARAGKYAASNSRAKTFEQKAALAAQQKDKLIADSVAPRFIPRYQALAQSLRAARAADEATRKDIDEIATAAEGKAKSLQTEAAAAKGTLR